MTAQKHPVLGGGRSVTITAVKNENERTLASSTPSLLTVSPSTSHSPPGWALAINRRWFSFNVIAGTGSRTITSSAKVLPCGVIASMSPAAPTQFRQHRRAGGILGHADGGFAGHGAGRHDDLHALGGHRAAVGTHGGRWRRLGAAAAVAPRHHPPQATSSASSARRWPGVADVAGCRPAVCSPRSGVSSRPCPRSLLGPGGPWERFVDRAALLWR